MVDFKISDDDLKIYDSWKVSKCDFKKELKSIKEITADCEVWNRGLNQMCLEWTVHNFCFALGIKKESTKDVDFEYPQSFWVRAAYAIVGVLTWIFIK